MIRLTLRTFAQRMGRARAPPLNIALYNLHMRTLGGGERRTALMASYLAQRHTVSLFVEKPVDLKVLERTFGIDLSRVRIIPIGTGDHAAAIASVSPDLLINNSHNSDLRCPAPHGIYMCMFPSGDLKNIGTYDVVTANSAFTAHWIRKRWEAEAEIVYSACAPMGPPKPKEKLILHVGRFSADSPLNHHKRQDVLVAAFAGLRREMAQGWRMHMVGNVDPSEDGRVFAEHVAMLGKDLPLTISHGLDIEALRDTYRRASIYWHGTGFAVNAAEEPDKQEHFGMAVVEAMSAGAVPLVFNGGGPREIVEHGRSGLLWSNPNELVAQTRDLIAAPRRLRSMARHAARRSRAFTARAFLARMDALIERLGPTREAQP